MGQFRSYCTNGRTKIPLQLEAEKFSLEVWREIAQSFETAKDLDVLWVLCVQYGGTVLIFLDSDSETKTHNLQSANTTTSCTTATQIINEDEQ